MNERDMETPNEAGYGPETLRNLAASRAHGVPVERQFPRTPKAGGLKQDRNNRNSAAGGESHLRVLLKGTRVLLK